MCVCSDTQRRQHNVFRLPHFLFCSVPPRLCHWVLHSITVGFMWPNVKNAFNHLCSLAFDGSVAAAVAFKQKIYVSGFSAVIFGIYRSAALPSSSKQYYKRHGIQRLSVSGNLYANVLQDRPTLPLNWPLAQWDSETVCSLVFIFGILINNVVRAFALVAVVICYRADDTRLSIAIDNNSKMLKTRYRTQPLDNIFNCATL